MQAVATGAQSILLGEADVVVAGGIESMSRMPYLIDAEDARWGHRMGNFSLVDAMYRDGFTCSLSGMIMGETAEVLARQYGITREESDRVRARDAAARRRRDRRGRFAAEIAPVTVTDAKGDARRSSAPTSIRGPTRPSSSCRSWRRCSATSRASPASSPPGPRPASPTAPRPLVLMSASKARSGRLAPMARVIGWASAGVDPRIMGIGPVPAMRKLFARTGLTLADFDLVELNEAFAAAGARRAARRADPAEKLNVNGGAIALGHPIGCTGARILVTLLYEMHRRRARRGLATLCVSGGMGMASDRRVDGDGLTDGQMLRDATAHHPRRRHRQGRHGRSA